MDDVMAARARFCREAADKLFAMAKHGEQLVLDPDQVTELALVFADAAGDYQMYAEVYEDFGKVLDTVVEFIDGLDNLDDD